MSDGLGNVAPLARGGHAAHVLRCMMGLPESQTEVDSSRLALAFYCLGTLDLLEVLKGKTSEMDRESWREWIWEQQTQGEWGSGFKPSSYMTAQRRPEDAEDRLEYNLPNLIMTYTALLSLAILRDDFARLDRTGLLRFLRACQREDGSFSTVPRSKDSDLRTVYCAFAISCMLDDWSGVDIDRALTFIAACRTPEGGYGQFPFCEAHGGTTYTAIASLGLAPSITAGPGWRGHLTESERQLTVRWLVQNQDASGGFGGRTEKEADACYCFWCSAALHILGAKELVNNVALARWLSKCQFKYGGIAKSPGEHPDPYHTYLSLATLSMYSPSRDEGFDDSWNFQEFDPVLNCRIETSEWARAYISGKGSSSSS